MLIQKELRGGAARASFTIEGCVTAFRSSNRQPLTGRVSQALFTCCLSWRLAAHQALEKCSSHVPLTRTRATCPRRRYTDR